MATSSHTGDAMLPSNRLPPIVGRVIVPTGWVATGVMLLATAFVRWFRTGPGSRFRGLDLADSIRSGVLSPSWGVWVALAVYSIVGVGGVYIATATVRHRGVVAARLATGAIGLVAFGLLAMLVIPTSNWAAGPTMASGAFLLACGLSAVQFATSPES